MELKESDPPKDLGQIGVAGVDFFGEQICCTLLHSDCTLKEKKIPNNCFRPTPPRHPFAIFGLFKSSYVAASKKVEGLVIAAVCSLKLVPEAELPLIL